MITLFLILVIIACVAISLFILVQNPKGGGLSGTFAGFNTQFMGVKQTTDVLEKGTWIMAAVIGLLCLFSAVFIPANAVVTPAGGNARPPASAPAPQQTQPPATVPPTN